jgi:hypothetical protein
MTEPLSVVTSMPGNGQESTIAALHSGIHGSLLVRADTVWLFAESIEQWSDKQPK